MKIRIQALKIRIQALEIRIQAFKIRIQAFKIRIQAFKIRIQAFKIRIQVVWFTGSNWCTKLLTILSCSNHFYFPGYFCLFLKHSSGGCLRSAPTANDLSTRWAKIWFLQLSNNCTAPEAQFRFIDKGVLQHISSSGCILPEDGQALPAVGKKLVVLAAKNVCVNKSKQAYTQTAYGSLRHASSKCIQPHTSFMSAPAPNAKIEYTAACNKTLQYFVLGMYS